MYQVEVFKRAIADDYGDNQPEAVDEVLIIFADTMLAKIIERYSLYSAKGSTIKRYAHNADQTMFSHIMNGLLPSLNIIKEAHKRGYLEILEATELKVFILAYLMHDLDKILNEPLNTKTKINTEQVRQKLVAELRSLGAEEFLPNFENWSAEILWLAVNTQRQHGVNLSYATFQGDNNKVADEEIVSEDIIAAFTPQTELLPPRVGNVLRDFCTFSDVVSFTVKSPEEAVYNYAATRSGGLNDILARYTENQFSLIYHQIAEVRGFLSNLINNATMRYLRSIYNQAGTERLVPLLFFPNGVLYLDCQSRQTVPTLSRADLNEAVKSEVREACQDAVEDGGGFGFSPLGLLKYPGYFHDFLKPEGFLRLFVRKTLSDSKANIAESTKAKMQEMQAAGRIPKTISLDYEPNERISMLGRFLINYTRLLGEQLGPNASEIKQELESRLVARFGEELWAEAKLIPSSGGLDYRFYWLGAQYLRLHPGIAVSKAQDETHSLEALFNELVEEMLALAGPQLETAPGLQGPYMQHLDEYLDKNLFFGTGATRQSQPSFRPSSLPDFKAELARYTVSKKAGNSPLTCTICNSAYPTDVQEDAAVLFQPWVYKNRLPLYKGSNAGGICSLCSLELMLRQILLKDRLADSKRLRNGGKDKASGNGRISVTGKKYEALELKYFFIYPDFFFTTQTARLAITLVERMENLKLFELGKQIRDKDVITSSDILDLRFFNSSKPDLGVLAEEEQAEQEAKGSMYLAERNAEKQYPGFVFFAKRTFSRESGAAATTASWVEAAWLGLALPLVMAARVVVTESIMPLYNSNTEFLETVVLDAPHQAVRYLLPSPTARLRLDELLGPSPRGISDNRVSGSLALLSRAIEMHLDTEASNGDPHLGRFNRIARDLATDKLWVFSFLQEQVRASKVLDAMPGEKAHHYNQIYKQMFQIEQELLVNALDDQSTQSNQTMRGDFTAMVEKKATRHEQAVELYLGFYSPFDRKRQPVKYPNTRAIVQPIDIAAKRIIVDTLNLTSEEIKLETRQELMAWLERVNKGLATGTAYIGKETELKIKAFVDFFYDEVFMGYAEGQRSLLNSRLNRFKNGCEAAFSDLMRERRLKKQSAEDLPDITQKDEDQ